MSNIKTKRRTCRTKKTKDILRGAKAVLDDLKIQLWEDHYKAVMDRLKKIDNPVHENKFLREALEIRTIIESIKRDSEGKLRSINRLHK